MSSDQRRTFLKQVGGLAAAAAAAAPLVKPTAAEAQEVILPPGPIKVREAARSTRVALELDNNFAGWVETMEGGTASAEVVVEKVGPDNIARKHISNVKYEDITIKCDAGMSKFFYDWLSATLSHKHARKDGAIVTADFSRKEISRLSFYSALLTEIGFPASDAGSKDSSFMTIKLSPEFTRKTPGFPGRQMPGDDTRQKWQTSNFKFSIEGMAPAKISKIEALTIKQKVTENPVGEQRDYEKEPATLEVPNLVVTFPESSASDFVKWHEDFVIKGNCSQEDEKGGTLDYLTPNLKEPLFSLNFGNVGIFRLTEDLSVQGSDQQHKWTAEMYCEEIKFDSHKSNS